jgi:hypothetical protein
VTANDCFAVAYVEFILEGTLNCLPDSTLNVIDIVGFTNSIPAGVGAKIQINNIRNPASQGTSGTFGVSIMRKGTNYIKEYRYNLLGIKVAAGTIEDILMDPVDAIAKQV